MILKQIKLKNFRQFYGEQTIVISPPGKNNITLVHAENGVGKTTLLNAVLWSLFGIVTKRFEQKDKIVNFAALAEGINIATIELTFEHEQKTYIAARNHIVTPGGHTKIKFEVLRVERNGNLSSPLPNPDSFVNTVIPRAMAPYFFFDGEQAETFSAEENAKAVSEAIRNILGCTLIENGADDLEYLGKFYNKELGKMPGEDEISKREAQISTLQARIETRKRQIKDYDANLISYQTQLGQIASKLREVAEAAQFQAQRESSQQQVDAIEKQIQETDGEILRWIYTKGIAVISEKLTRQTLDFIKQEELRGKIPSPYNEEFVKGLLESEKCICDRPLHPATNEWKAVQSMLLKAANAEIMGRVVRASARIVHLKEMKEDAPSILRKEESKLSRLLDEKRNLNLKIDELGKKIANIPIIEIRERELARKELETKRDHAKEERIRLQVGNERDEVETKRLNSEITELAQKNQKAMKLVRRRDVSFGTAEILRAYLGKYEDEARTEIEISINKILEKTARKHYKIEIDPSFGVRLLFSDGTLTPKSGGENQLMSLAFMAALVRFAEDRSKNKNDGIFIPATVAPLVLDSPFGQLDNSYRTDTAEFVPKMAPQVILLVSSSQGKAEVIDSFGDKIGNEYVLIAENKGSKGDKREDLLTVKGKTITTTKFDCARNMTRILEVK